ncbi:hypothetical protein [Mesorhizobium sp. IMUNJ 23232]|uniref:hypothetical protein n=1 Tax=Mesorhizobium sp. IMUNJ 23232 TaxID=3376064 RepID=UPI0037AA542E
MALRRGLLIAFTAVGCGNAIAADITGHYRMEGVDTKGNSYSGSADISMSSESNCRIKFSDGFGGICLVSGDQLAVAYDVHGKLGLSLYEIGSDGSLDGTFIDDYHGGGVGREKLTPAN